MALLVRSSEGDIQTNSSDMAVDSPATITATDALCVVSATNEDTASTISRPAGYSQQYNNADVSMDTREMMFLKTATAQDNTDAGTANHYVFGNYGSTDDHCFGCIAIYDSLGGGTPVYVSSARNEVASGGTSTQGPSLTINNDNSIAIYCWVARNGDYYNIGSSNTITSGGTTDTNLSSGWVNNTMSGQEWVVYAHEVGTAQSPFQPTLNHLNITSGDGQACVAHLFEPAGGGGGLPASQIAKSILGLGMLNKGMIS